MMNHLIYFVYHMTNYVLQKLSESRGALRISHGFYKTLHWVKRKGTIKKESHRKRV
jgi:hypothetical protein